MSSLYVVGTPIGNLGDMSDRAIEVLRRVDCVAAEDTRHSKKLLLAKGIDTPLVSLHQHNESARSQELIKRLQKGESIALISDAGTPGISDPGMLLVSAAHQHGIRVHAVPGPSAVAAALSVSGISGSSFLFSGFVPSKPKERGQHVSSWSRESRPIVFYETPHRIEATLSLLARLYPERLLVLCREMTKSYETVRRDSCLGMYSWVCQDANQRRGEFALVLSGAEQQEAEVDWNAAIRLAREIAQYAPPKSACKIAAKEYQIKANALYQRFLELDGV